MYLNIGKYKNGARLIQKLTPLLREFMYFVPSSLIHSLLFLPWRLGFHINQKFPTQGIKPEMAGWLSNYAVGTFYCSTDLESERAFMLHCRCQGLKLG